MAKVRKLYRDDPLAALPAWARKLAERYYTKTVSTFLLYGAVRDLQPISLQDRTAGFGTLKTFLSHELLAAGPAGSSGGPSYCHRRRDPRRHVVPACEKSRRREPRNPAAGSERAPGLRALQAGSEETLRGCGRADRRPGAEDRGSIAEPPGPRA